MSMFYADSVGRNRMSKGPPPKCSECKDVFLTNPDSKKDGVCRECKGKVGMSKMGKGFKYQ